MTLALQRGTDVVDDAVTLLTEGRPAREAQQLLGAAIVAMSDRAADIGRQEKLFSEVNALFTLIMGPYGELQGDIVRAPDGQILLTGLQRVRLIEAVRLAERLGKPDHNNNAFWRGIIAALRAECLYLLGEMGAACGAALTAQAMLKTTAGNPYVDGCDAYVAHLLSGAHPPVTRLEFLNALHENLHQA